MTRVLGLALAALLTLVGLAAALALWGMGNDAVSRWVLRQAAPAVPGALTLRGVDGNLLDGMQFDELRYVLDGLTVEARELELRVRLPDLLERRVTVRRLRAASVSVSLARAPDEEQAAGLPAVTLPVDLRLDAVAVEQLDLRIADLSESVQGLRGRAAWTDDRLRFERLAATVRGVSATAHGEVRFAGDYPLELAVEWDAPQAQLAGDGRFRGDLAELVFDHRLRVPETVVLEGTLRDLTGSPRAGVVASWDAISRAVPGVGTVEASDGRLEAEGELASYNFALTTTLSGEGLPAAVVRLQARGDTEAVQIVEAVADTLGGRITARGRLAFGSGELSGQLVAAGVEPAGLRPDLGGTIDARATVTGRLPDRFDIAPLQVDAMLNGQPLVAEGAVRISGTAVSVAGLEIASGENRLTVDGQVWPRPDGRFTVRAQALGLLLPGATGRLEGRGTVAGTLAAPDVDVTLDGTDLGLAGQRIGRAALRARVAPDRVDIDLDAAGLATGDVELGDLELRVDGTLASHRLNIVASDGPVAGELSGRGGLDGSTLTAEFDAGRLAIEPTGDWRLAAPVTLETDGRRWRLGAHCWVRGEASACAGDTALAGDRLEVMVTLAQFPLAPLSSLLGDEFGLEGTVTADLAIRRDGEKFDASFDWVQTGTRLAWRQAGAEEFSSRFDEFRVSATATREQAVFDAQVRGDYGVEIDATGHIDRPLADDARLDATLRAAVPDLGAPTPLINRYVRLDSVQGRLEADLRLQGPLDAPELGGEARLVDGFAYVPQAGIDLQDVNVQLTGRPGRAARLTGSARSDGGRLELDGTVSIADGGLQTTLAVTGEDFRVLRFPEQSVWIAPDLDVVIDAGRIDLTGQVLVPRAEIVLDVLPETATTPSPDTVVHDGNTERARPARLEVVGQVEVVMGDDVYFAARGLDTRLGGNLVLQRSAGAVVPTAKGVLRTIDGRFSAYGKQLTIERGALIFSGPLDDPNLDVRATREVAYDGREYRVGVLLTGPISNIQTAVFSDPSTSEANALSLLVLDRPLDQGEGLESPELTGAAVALGLTRVLPITERLEENLGLDEVRFEGMGADDTAVVAGKRLSSDLYLRFSYGLFNQIGTFIVRYRLGGGLSIEAGSGQEQTLDLVFSVDR